VSHSIEDGPARFLGDGPGAKARRRHRRRDESNVETPSEWTAGQQPAEHYRAAAARGRTLVAEATTPRVKEYLESLIHQCERLAGQVEKQIKPSFRRETGRMR
jgi:hypothetical protein